MESGKQVFRNGEYHVTLNLIQGPGHEQMDAESSSVPSHSLKNRLVLPLFHAQHHAISKDPIFGFSSALSWRESRQIALFRRCPYS